MFKHIQFTNPHRQKHFDFFNSMDRPHFNICANVEITGFIHFLKEKNLAFTPSIVYFISRVANEIPEFRYRIRAGSVIEHQFLHPSFSVSTEATDVFSFCLVDYVENFNAFVNNALVKMEEMKTQPSFEDEVGRDDYLFLSAIPWVAFTGFEHAMHYSPADSVPRITWGKYFSQNEKIMMPLSVQAHHAVVDGRHTGKYFQLFEKYMQKPPDFIEK